MSTLQPPTADQLAAARLTHWRQDAPTGEAASAAALLTLESVRSFVSTCGLLLFAPRPQHIPSPAPSLVEATLGKTDAAPTLADSAVARGLLARLIAEGSAVPLNLLGAPSTTPDAPDFVASAATFAYIFTLRGDKAFKQPPSTSGATKVSPLALNTYNLLVENGPTSAYDLVTQLGKEVTEAAVLRSLSELWQHLRVIPVPQPDGAATLWETVASRFTKQLKAGANAGQPSALSALISLYLSQSLLATEGEIETFLSPLAPRSRVREVLHALTGARQIETVAVDGKTHLHIHGELPSFITPAESAGTEQHAEADLPSITLAEDGSRIRKFIPKPRKIGTGYVERAKPFASSRPPREGRPFDRKGPPPRDRGSRTYSKSPGGSAARPVRPAFDKPWDEEKQQRQRTAFEAANAPGRDSGEPSSQEIHLDAGPQTSPGVEGGRKFEPSSGAGARFGGGRPAYGRKPASGGDRPAFRRDAAADGRPQRREFTPREGSDSRPPRRDFAGSGKPSFGERKPFAKPGFTDRGRDGFPPRPSGDRPTSNDKDRRPFRRDNPVVGSDSRPPRRDFSPRGDSASRPPRREFTPRSDGAGRPPRDSFSKPRVSRDRPDGEAAGGTSRSERPAFRKFDAPRKPFSPREGGESRPPRRDFTGTGKPSFGSTKTYERSGPGAASGSREGGYAGKRPGSSYPAKREGSSYSGKREGSGYEGKRADSGYAGKREGGGYAGKKPYSAASGSFAGKKTFAGNSQGRRSPDAPGASTFDKFKGGNKPWGKRPPGRKPKPEGDKA